MSAVLFSAALAGKQPPIHFEPNVGQAAPEVQVVGRAGRYTLLLAGNEAQFVAEGASVRMRLSGASRSRPISTARQQGVSHYYLGSRQENWHTNVPHFQSVRWAAIYPGIDLLYYSNDREIEYDFILAPGADPKQIALQFSGYRSIAVSADGALRVQTTSGEWIKRKPLAYQQARGRRLPVDARFLIKDNTVRFALGSYDPSMPLTIDPRVAYSTLLGGNGNDEALGIAVDSAGSAILTGNTTSTNFPASRPSLNALGFVTKLNPAGSAIVYSAYLGGAANTYATSIAVDAAGNAYICGQTFGDYPLKNALQSDYRGEGDLFVTPLSPTGEMIYSTYLGGSQADSGRIRNGIQVDSTGAAYVAGWTQSANFPLVNPYQNTLRGLRDAFLAKINPAGSALIFSTYFGGNGEEFTNGLALDPNGNPVIVGRTDSANLPTRGALQNLLAGFFDGFVAKFNPTGSELLYSTYFGAGGLDSIDGIAINSSAAYLLFGAMGSPGLPAQSAGSFLRRLTEGGGFTSLMTLSNAVWMTAAFDPAGNIIAAGNNNLNSIPSIPVVDAIRVKPAGPQQILLFKLKPTGETIFSTYYGGSHTQVPSALAVDSAASIYLTGITNSFDIYAKGPVQPLPGGAHDAFVLKLAEGATQRLIGLIANTSPADLPTIVDGKTYANGGGVQGLAGELHTIGTVPELIQGNTRYTFDHWSDGGAISHTLGIPLQDDSTITAFFRTDVKLNIRPAPPQGGSVSITPASPDGYYAPDTALTLRATPAPGYIFTGWSGDISSTANPLSYKTENAGRDIRANFQLTDPNRLQPHYFVAVTPCRLLDSRYATMPAGFGPPVLAGGASRDIAVPFGPCGIPASAKAYSLNITVVPQEPLAFLTVWPTGQDRPVVSTLNSFDGQTVANAAIVPAGANGSISLFGTNRTHVIVDINGYFTTSSGPGALLFFPMIPCRVADTRSNSGFPGDFGPPSVAAHVVRNIPVLSGSCAIPSAARAVSANFTAVPQQGSLGYLSVFPKGQVQPAVSTLNSPLGQVRANAAIVPLGAGGAISLESANTTDVVIDINGYFAPLSAGAGLFYYPLPPCRAVDTRAGEGIAFDFGPPLLNAQETRAFQLSQSLCALPVIARAFSLNVTVVPRGPLAFLALWQFGQVRPLASTLNAFEGQILANAAIVPGNLDTRINVFAVNPTDVIIDVNGFFAQ
ncbi:MAG TPA: SBBP repeat-containing protein [Bryobacteraceae bacterium]|nr:SBBP repeat-containing protein [Bryobacteraceae bacterium]